MVEVHPQAQVSQQSLLRQNPQFVAFLAIFFMGSDPGFHFCFRQIPKRTLLA